MSSCLRLFYAVRLGNRIQCSSIFIFLLLFVRAFCFLCFLYFSFCSRLNLIQIIFQQIKLTRHGILIDSTSPTQSGFGTNSDKKLLLYFRKGAYELDAVQCIYQDTSGHFKKSPEYLTRGTAQVFITLIRFLLDSSVWSSFLVLLRSFFLIFSFISTCLMVSATKMSKYLYVFFSPSVHILS